MADDKAYDGSDAPQRRPLTARERDILCRILSKVIFAHGREARTAGDGAIAALICPSELRDAIAMHVALDPRE